MTAAQEQPPPGDSTATSRSLLARASDDDPRAWDHLVELYAPLVLHWCKRMGVAVQDSADILQDVFQAVASKINTFRKANPSDTFRGWLRTITRNKIIDHFRRRNKEPQGAGGTDAHLRWSHLLADNNGNLDGNDDDGACQELFQRALQIIQTHFEERTWQAFWRVVVDGGAPADVGDELGLSAGAVRVAKSRVLQRLRRELGDLLD